MDNRLRKLRQRLGHRALVLVNGEVQDANVTYFTGLYDHGGVFYADRKKACFVRYKSLNADEERKCRCRVAVAQDAVEWLKGQKPKAIAINEERLPHSAYKKLRKIAPVTDFSKELKEMRAVKDKEELRCIRKARKLALEVFDDFRFKGSEREIYSRLVCGLNEASEGSAFAPIVAADRNSRNPHHVAGQCRPRKLLLVDFGAKCGNYLSDLTRMVYLRPPAIEVQKAQHAVEEAVVAASYAAVPGAKAADVDKAACDALKARGYRKNILHATGHGVGLEIHEAPSISPKSEDVLREGMVFTIEPGVYLPGFGIRLEDDYIVTKNGARLI